MSVPQVVSPKHVSADDEGPVPAKPDGDVRLVWAAQEDQRIRGVWWPRSRSIATEMTALLPTADDYLGAPLIRVSLNPLAWDHQPRRLYAGSRIIRMAWFDSIDPATVGIGAIPVEPIMLCVVPPEWTAAAGRTLFRALRDTKVWPTEADQVLQLGADIEMASAS